MVRLWLISLLLLLAACDTGDVVVDPGVNRTDAAITRDVIILRSAPATIAFASISAGDWAVSRAEIIATWGNQIELQSFDIAAGGRAAAFAIPRRGLRGVIIFTRAAGGRVTRRVVEI